MKYLLAAVVIAVSTMAMAQDRKYDNEPEDYDRHDRYDRYDRREKPRQCVTSQFVTPVPIGPLCHKLGLVYICYYQTCHYR